MEAVNGLKGEKSSRTYLIQKGTLFILKCLHKLGMTKEY